MFSVASAWYQAMGLRYPCIYEREPLPRCEICGWLFTPFDDWTDHVRVYDDVINVMYRICQHHPELGEMVPECTRGIDVPMLAARSQLRILAHEAAYWLRTVVRFVWIEVSWHAQVLYVRIFRPAKYRRYQAFMRGELFKETD